MLFLILYWLHIWLVVAQKLRNYSWMLFILVMYIINDMICKCNHKIAYICRFGQAIRQSSWGSSLLKRYHLSPSQPSITVTLHRSMQLKMPSLLMKLSLRRCSERSLRVKTRSMTQCWALFVRSLQNSFFQIMSYLNKQRFPHNEIFKEKCLSIQILKWHQAIYLFCSNSWKRDCFFFPIITNMSQIIAPQYL